MSPDKIPLRTGPDAAGWAKRAAGLAGWRAWVAAAVLGALGAAAMPPAGFVLALVPAFSGLVWLAEGRDWKGALNIGWCFGFGHFAAGFYWIANAFYVDAALYGWLAPGAVAGLTAGMAIFPAIAVGATAELSRHLALRPWARAVALAAFWTLSEWLRGQMFTGFPWNLAGTVWVVSDIMLQSAAWIGVFGLGLVTVCAAALPAAIGRDAGARDWAVGLSGLALLALFALGGWARLSGAENASVDGVRLRLVQPNIPQHLKWHPDLKVAHVKKQIEMSRAPAASVPPTHVIWAETAVPFNLASDRPLQKVLGLAAPAGGLLVTGAPRAAGAPGAGQQLWNSAHAITPNGVIVATYDKQHLVPFGEYVPLRGLLGFSKLTAGRLDFSPGTGARVIDLPGLPSAAVLICYEVIFPGEVPGHRPDGLPRPGWLLNLTNDAWFGMSAGPYQHLAAARLRAAEQGLPLVRVANTGISAVIDAYGRTRAELALGQPGVLDAALPTALAETPYARFGAGMHWALILAALALAAGLGRRGGAAAA